MKTFKTLLLLLLFVGTGQTVVAQKAKLKRANKLFEKLNYQEAIPLYLEILDKRDFSEAKINLADSYRMVGDVEEAAFWYGQVMRLQNIKPIHKLYYGMALQANGKCDEAMEWFKEYNYLVPEDMRGAHLAAACEETVVNELLAKGTVYKVKHLAALNTTFDDFSPAFYKDGLIFSSERFVAASVKREHSWTGRPFVELFHTKTKLKDADTYEYAYSKPERFSTVLNSKFHDGPVTFSKDFKTVFFTRNNVYKGRTGKDDEGITRVKVYTAEKDEEGNWTDVYGMPFNSDEYSVAHPTLSADGLALYFSSDMPGGFGGMDLYASYFESGRWSPPINLGPQINSEGNELFPFIHDDGTLYFSSNGFIGLGGLDIFSSSDKSGTWSPPINLGFPLNSRDDDFGFILDEDKNHGFFTSNRQGGAGLDDIYSFVKYAKMVEVLVFDEDTEVPIVGAKITSEQLDGREFTTGTDGKIFLEIPVEKKVEFLAEKDFYENNKGKTRKSTREKEVIRIPLQKPVVYEIAGLITDEDSGLPIVGTTLLLENKAGEVVGETVSNIDGTYTFKDITPGECYLLKIQKDKYFSKSSNICAEGLSRQNNVVQSDVALVTLVDVDDNSRIFVLDHIYYDFNKAYIRGDAEKALIKLIDILTSNPSLIVEIGSHTDARGQGGYNERLSARRAEAVVRYLIQRGVSKNRLRAKGYGETITVNGCINNVKCDEEQHQKNRRTEFKVVGTLEGKEIEATSAEPAFINTDRCLSCPF